MPVYPTFYDDQSIANIITRGGYHWNQSSITYSFNNNSTAGNALNSVFQSWVNTAIQTIEELISFDFVQTAGAGTATINGSRDSGTYAYGTWNTPGHDLTSGQIYFDQAWATNQPASLSLGSFGYMTIMHELLHGVGLLHPGYYDLTASYFVDAAFQQDTRRYTVMSYFNADQDGSGTSHWFKSAGVWDRVFPQTPMVYDLLALTNGAFGGLFAGYNANPYTRAADTVYGYNATGGINQVFNFTTNASPVLTIYDAGGIDTLDLSGDTVTTARTLTYDAAGDSVPTDGVRTTTVIDIRPGGYSSTHGMSNNIGIAFGTYIENVIGTQFADIIYGNIASNALSGGLGNDYIYGGDSYDVIEGGFGADVLDGGDNHTIYRDMLSYASSNAAVQVNLLTNIVAGGHAAGDTVTRFGSVTGSAFNDILISGIGIGGAGNDFLFGTDFGSVLGGGTGSDWLVLRYQNFISYNSTARFTDYSAGDNIYLGGQPGSIFFWTYGADAYVNSILVTGAATANLTVITQASEALMDGANLTAIQSVMAGGINALGAFGAYSLNVFDANANDVWHTIVSAYTPANTLDSVLTTYDAGQPYHSVNSDYDQSASGNWAAIDTYYSAASTIDFKWLAYDSGQPLYAANLNFDQALTSTWSEIQTFYSTPGVTDFSYIYYDAGQPLYCSSVNYDQAANQTWSRIETFLSSAAATDFYWTYYDAGQPYFAATVDYDQTSGNTWSNIQTFFASAGVTDFTWAYFDAGQPLYARLIDYDQGNLYAWSQHVVEYDTSTHVLNDYYI